MELVLKGLILNLNFGLKIMNSSILILIMYIIIIIIVIIIIVTVINVIAKISLIFRTSWSLKSLDMQYKLFM